MAGKPGEGMSLDEAALLRHLAKGAEVEIVAVESGEGEKNLREMLSKYISVLDAHEQKEDADAIRRLLHDWQASFVKAVPRKK